MEEQGKGTSLQRRALFDLEFDKQLKLSLRGMVCLEVVFKTGVPVRCPCQCRLSAEFHRLPTPGARETPSRKAKTVATLKCRLSASALRGLSDSATFSAFRSRYRQGGEYVFAHTQNFDGSAPRISSSSAQGDSFCFRGWLKLSGKPEGWVLANDSAGS